MYIYYIVHFLFNLKLTSKLIGNVKKDLPSYLIMKILFKEIVKITDFVIVVTKENCSFLTYIANFSKREGGTILIRKNICNFAAVTI